MAVNIVNDKVLEKQENKNDKFKLKLLKYPKKLCEATKAIQAGFVKEFQEKFKKLTPESMVARIDLSLSDELPFAQAFVVISAENKLTNIRDND